MLLDYWESIELVVALVGSNNMFCALYQLVTCEIFISEDGRVDF